MAGSFDSLSTDEGAFALQRFFTISQLQIEKVKRLAMIWDVYGHLLNET